MKNPDILLKIAIVFSVIVFLATVDDFLSLHDIYKDYVSQAALQYLEVETSKELPGWTDTRGEWMAVTISFFVRFFAMIIIVVTLLLYRKKVTQNQAKHN